MIRIAVVDDEKTDLVYIEKKIKQQFELRNIACSCTSFTDAVQALNENMRDPFHAIFLDIDMPQLSGLDMAEKINALSAKTLIIFVTNHDELVYKAFRFKAIGFIRKRFFDEEADEMIDILLSEIQRNSFVLKFKDSHSIIKINLSEVLFIKSDDHYVEFYFADDKKECIRQNLNDVRSRVEHYGFLQVHSRYLVNCKYVYSIEQKTVVLTNGIQLPLSRSRSTEVKEKFQLYLRSV